MEHLRSRLWRSSDWMAGYAWRISDRRADFATDEGELARSRS